MTRRFFAPFERAAIFRKAGGRCELCGRELDASFHADHIHPYSRGGDTQLENAAALCPACNLRKTNQMTTSKRTARRWQQRMLADFKKQQIGNADRLPFLATVCTGAGKTFGASMIAGDLFASREVEQIIVLVSAVNTISGHVAAGRENGYTLLYRPNAKLTYGLPADVQGAVLTYQQVAQNGDVLQRLVSARPTLVVFDEPHHLADRPGWGESAAQATYDAKFELLLTATPVRSDRQLLPWADLYERIGDKFLLRSSFTHDYLEALNETNAAGEHDPSVRLVLFHAVNAEGRWVEDEEIVAATFDDDVDAKGESARLRAFLDPQSASMKEMLASAVAKLAEIRATDPKAGMLVVAQDIAHARRLATHIRQAHGLRCVTVSTDDADAGHPEIDAFRKSADPVLVSVGMVTEGTDVPRLRVLVYATNKATQLLFTQIVGRVLRFQRGTVSHAEQVAHAFMPADPRFVEWAATFKDAVKEFEEKKQRDPSERDGGDPLPPVQLLGSTPLDGRDIDAAAGFVHDADMLAEAERFKAAHRSPMESGFIATVLRWAGVKPEQAAAPESRPTHDHDELSKRVNRMVGALEARTLEPHSHIHARLNRFIGIEKGTLATVEQLLRKIGLLEAELANAPRRQA